MVFWVSAIVSLVMAFISGFQYHVMLNLLGRAHWQSIQKLQNVFVGSTFIFFISIFLATR